MTPSIADAGRLPRDPQPGSRAYEVLQHNLTVRRLRHDQLVELAGKLPHAIADERFWIRDLELRLGMPPSFPAVGHDDRPAA